MVVNKYIVSSYDVCLSQCSQEGRRRNPANWTYDSVPQPQYMHRGYTFHEMLDEFGLINMNGRCYDPVVGRFLSPDIVVQNPNNTQCYNRYSYAINNPLKYTDPNGWSWTPIQAANHANMMAMTMTMRLQDNFQPSVIRSGSSSRGNGFGFGPNGIIFQNAEATLQMALGDIAHILSTVFGIPGLWGNPGNDDPNEDVVKTDENLVDRTSQFNKTVKDTKEYFSTLRIITDASCLLLSPEVVVASKLYVFSQLTETGAKFDLKNGEYSEKNADKYSLYNGKKVFFEEYGNYNFGVASAAFGIPIEITLAGAGLNELWKWWKNEDGNPDFSNWIGFFDNRDATSGIIRGYFGYPFK